MLTVEARFSVDADGEGRIVRWNFPAAYKIICKRLSGNITTESSCIIEIEAIFLHYLLVIPVNPNGLSSSIFCFKISTDYLIEFVI